MADSSEQRQNMNEDINTYIQHLNKDIGEYGGQIERLGFSPNPYITQKEFNEMLEMEDAVNAQQDTVKEAQQAVDELHTIVRKAQNTVDELEKNIWAMRKDLADKRRSLSSNEVDLFSKKENLAFKQEKLLRQQQMLLVKHLQITVVTLVLETGASMKQAFKEAKISPKDEAVVRETIKLEYPELFQNPSQDAL